MSRKGYFFTTDAIIAAGILIGIALATTMFYVEETPGSDVHFLASDLINVLSTLTVGEVTNSYVTELIAKGNITDMDATLLEQIGQFWAEGKDRAAENLSREVIGMVMPQGYSYGVWINDNMTYNITRSAATHLFSYRRMISGIERAKPISGYTSTIFLNSIENRLTSSFAYFGGFVGEGNISVFLTLPSNFTNTSLFKEIILEIDPGTDFKLFVNEQFAGDFPAGSGGGGIMVPDRWTIDQAYHALFRNGTNNISIKFVPINENFTASGPKYIGGGFIKATYFSNELDELELSFSGNDTATKRFYLPGIDGFINIYSSIYVPGQLKGMSAYLHYNSSYETYLKISNVTVHNNESNGTATARISNSTLFDEFDDDGFDLSDIGLLTIPIRMGFEEVSLGSSPADIVLVTDVSGSMSAVEMQGSGGRMEGNAPYVSFSGSATAGNSVTFTFNLTDVSFSYESLDVYADGSSGGNVDLYVTRPSAAEARAQCDEEPDACNAVDNDRDEYYYRNGPNEGLWSIRVRSTTTQTVTAHVYLSKIDAARKAGDNFVESVLSHTGPQVGLVSYENSVSSTHALSDDEDDLISEIDGYNAGGGTCICCGILEGTNILNPSNQAIIISRKSGPWKYNDNDLGSPPANWETLAYNDAAWKTGTGVFRNNYWSLGNPSTSLIKYEGDYYFRKKFNISDASSILGASLFVLSDNGASIYLNGNLIDNNYGVHSEMEGNANYWDRDDIDIDPALFVDGENIIAGRLYNRQTCFFFCWVTDVAFDLELAVDLDSPLGEVRQKTMIVMSDGMANEDCPLSSVPDHDGDGDSTDDPQDDAIEAACRAHEDYGIRVHAVGLGDTVDQETLQAIASCGEGSYHNSTTVEELESVYEDIGNEEIAFSATQIANTSGVRVTKLFPDSYIECNYTPLVSPTDYGKIPIMIEGLEFGNNQSSGLLFLPDSVTLTELKATSYSSDKWTSLVSIRNIASQQVFNLSAFGSNYQPLGDAFIVNIPTSFFVNGMDNNVTVRTGISPANMSGGSERNRLIYSVRVDRFISPGGVFARIDGCNWTFELEDGSFRELLVPASYAGTGLCRYTTASHQYNTSVNSTDDGLQYGMFEILDLFDFDDDGRVSVDLTENNLNITTYHQSGVPSMWGPAIAEVRVWK